MGGWLDGHPLKAGLWQDEPLGNAVPHGNYSRNDYISSCTAVGGERLGINNMPTRTSRHAQLTSSLISGSSRQRGYHGSSCNLMGCSKTFMTKPPLFYRKRACRTATYWAGGVIGDTEVIKYLHYSTALSKQSNSPSKSSRREQRRCKSGNAVTALHSALSNRACSFPTLLHRQRGDAAKSACWPSTRAYHQPLQTP